jgi:uncharacterized protein YlaI
VDNKVCYVCEKPVTAKNEVGINKKLFGRKITKFYCYACLAEHLELEIDELLDKIEDFKSQGCALFE